VRLASFLSHAEGIAAPMRAAADGRVSVELIVGLPAYVPLTDGGRDLDNYLLPLAQRLSQGRIAAMFGRRFTDHHPWPLVLLSYVRSRRLANSQVE
jgi:hypothetical protein